MTFREIWTPNWIRNVAFKTYSSYILFIWLAAISLKTINVQPITEQEEFYFSMLMQRHCSRYKIGLIYWINLTFFINTIFSVWPELTAPSSTIFDTELLLYSMLAEVSRQVRDT